jgi:hypothetical protein
MGLDGNTLKELAIKVSQYFLDFLESDFKRQQAPRRRVILQTDSGFKSGMRVSPYPDLQRDLWRLLQNNAPDQTLKMMPRSYHRPITPTLRAIIKEQVQALAEESLVAIRHEVAGMAQTTRGRAVENPEAWVDGIRKALAAEIGTQLINPLLAMLDGPLSDQAYSVHDSIFSTETELIELVASKTDQILPEVLSLYLATGDLATVATALEATLTIEETKSALAEYFEKYMAADAFLEFRDLETYASTAENMQLYLYVGTLKYGNLTFPLFYVPIEVLRAPDTGGYTFGLVRHLYANKRAIDFVLQELGQRQQREWLSPIKERISYLDPTQSLAQVAEPLFREILNALDLGGQITLKGGAVDQACNTNVAVSTALHLSVFDRADEALLNDYEEMIAQARKNEDGVIGLFQGIVKGVLLENPKSIQAAVESEWDALPLVDRVVINSPVPLNEEQIKILAAIRQPEGRIIVVEGPPGTGKSHTITAIAADSALRGRSCLILSDKAEALNVVQSKLSDAMNQVRHDKNFPNPILRLGQDQANFKRLTSNQALASVGAYVKAAKANQPRIQAELHYIREQLRDDIAKTVGIYGGLPVTTIQNVFAAESGLETVAPNLAATLRGATLAGLAANIAKAYSCLGSIHAYLSVVFAEKSAWSSGELMALIKLDCAAVEIAGLINTTELELFDRLSIEDSHNLTGLLIQYEKLRMPIFGYLFRGGAVGAIEHRIYREYKPTRAILLKKDKGQIQRILTTVQELRRVLPSKKLTETDISELYKKLLTQYRPPEGASAAYPLLTALQNAFAPSNFPKELLVADNGNGLTKTWLAALEYLNAWAPVADAFANVPEMDYAGTMSQLEKLSVTTMNAEVDNRLVSFMNNFRTEAKTLASVISNRQKFPEDKFGNVKESFPVIIASIRQFGEYMPLAPELFDVVVIDEASQVSVAQAFPALLRAKKIVVLGDSKQFSNTKSSNASNELNDKYRSELEAFFKQRISNEASMLQRLAKFDVKCSILDFCQLCANYSTILRKHFRSYQELISYSSETFYGGQLQAIKIRGVPIDDVIRFDQVDSSMAKTSRGTNEAEAEFILEKLLELLKDEEPPTVGIITPFREQQALLTKKLFAHAKGRDFQDLLRLKIMTFDSCQGEERKIIFYSMVATAEHDMLNYVFPVELHDAEEIVEEKLKLQRLNVGFSRAEEMIWFVHSKPIVEFKGSIAKVMNHYSNLLEKVDVSASRTDQSSPMEAKVLDWLQKTAFYQKHREFVEILPQFPIGDYLRQLDPTYQHPAWRVDFLITFTTPKGMSRIVVEYDGFEFHFEPGKHVNVGNHERYMLEADVERQLTLESYGYRFLRINRFNLGKDPVQTLSDRLERLVEKLHDEGEVKAVKGMQEEAEGLANKTLKTCPSCGQNRPIEDYFDQYLRDGEGGMGRKCKPCKEGIEEAKRSRMFDRANKAPGRRRRWR